MAINIEVRGGPLDGGEFVFNREPPHLTTAYAPFQPSDRGWSPDRPTVKPEHLVMPCAFKPSGERQARYLYSEKCKRFVYDGSGRF